jgi:hypothetical protein
MIQPSEHEKATLQQLRGSAVEAFLSRAYADVKEQLLTQSAPDTVRLLQGQGQLLRQILGYINPEGFSTNGKRG